MGEFRVFTKDVIERGRLACLRNLNILDTAADERLDRVTQMAAQHFNVPMCALSLVDEDRQWFKSKVGLDAPETPRCHAFCDHTIRDHAIMVVSDALADARFNNNPLVLGDPKIRFYAGAPVVIDDTFSIGSLCVIDTVPRSFSIEDERKLAALAKTAERLIADIYRTSSLLNRMETSAHPEGHAA